MSAVVFKLVHHNRIPCNITGYTYRLLKITRATKLSQCAPTPSKVTNQV